MCLGNNQGNFQLRRFTTSDNSFCEEGGLLFWLTLYVRLSVYPVRSSNRKNVKSWKFQSYRK